MKNNYLFLALFSFLCFSSYAADWTKVTDQVPNGNDYTFLKVSETTCFAFVLSGNFPNYVTKILKTTNGGTNWDTIPNNGLYLGTEAIKAVASGTNIYALGASGLYKSTDNAASWTLINNPLISGMYSPTDILVDGTDIYVGSPSGLFKTNNEFLTIKNFNYNLKISTVNYQTICVAKLNNRLYTTTSSKVWYLVDTTWTQVSGLPDRASYFNNMAFVNSTYYLSDKSANSGAYSFYQSSDGITWTNLSDFYISDYFISNNYLWATKVASGTFKRHCIYTNNSTINDISTGLPLFSMCNGLVVLGTNLYLGVKGSSASESGIYTRSISSLPTSVNNSNIVSDIDFQLYPNPVNDVLNINSNVPFSSYRILTTEGKEIQNKILNNSQINVSSLISGSYIILLTTEEGFTLRRLLIKN